MACMLCVHIFFNTNRLESFTLPVGNVPSCIQFTLSMKPGFPVIILVHKTLTSSRAQNEVLKIVRSEDFQKNLLKSCF